MYESLQHPTIAVLLIIKILILFFQPLSNAHLFQSNQRLQPVEFMYQQISEKV